MIKATGPSQPAIASDTVSVAEPDDTMIEMVPGVSPAIRPKAVACPSSNVVEMNWAEPSPNVAFPDRI